MDCWVEPTWYYDKLWTEFLYDWEEKCVTCISILSISKIWDMVVHPIKLIYLKTGLPCNINIKSFGFTFTHIISAAFCFVWVKSQIVTSMQRHIQKSFFFVEDRLSSISVMNVPIKNANSFHSLVNGNLCSESCIVKETKSRWYVMISMMTWRSDDTVSFKVYSF